MKPTDGDFDAGPTPFAAFHFGMNEKSIVDGAEMTYRGDHIRFGTAFLNSKHQGTGTFILPKIEHEEPNTGKRRWGGIPIAEGAKFTILKIEVNRRGKPTKKNPEGKQLENLAILICDEFPNSVWGVTFTDIIAKFDLLSSPDALSDKFVEPDASKIQAMEWSTKTMETGW